MDISTVVRTVLEKNPGMKAKELIAKVREKTGLSRSVVYGHLGSFEVQGKIYREKGRYWLEKPQKIEEQSSNEFLLHLNLSKVVAAIERLWDILMRSPTREEIAFETGVPPEEAEKLAYKTAPQTGWFNPSPEIIEESTRKLGEILYCEALMKAGKVREDGQSTHKSISFGYDEDDMEIVEEAKRLRYLREHPKVFAVIDGEGNFVSWSREAEKYLRGYKPKHRLVRLDAFVLGPPHDPWRPHRGW